MRRIILTLALLGPIGCTTLKDTAPLDNIEIRHARIVRERIVVLPVVRFSRSSGFPVSPTAVIGAAHILDLDANLLNGAYGLVSAGGYPMMAGKTTNGLPRGEHAIDDWMMMYCATERFQYNRFDADVSLKRNDLVFVGGYVAARMPKSTTLPISMPPSVTTGRVMDRVSPPCDQRQLLHIAVPFADYGGGSGGPVAIVAADGELRVFGLMIQSGWVWDDVDKRYRWAMVVLRLTEDDVNMARTRVARRWGFPHAPQTTRPAR